jgi:hypothetical protein
MALAERFIFQPYIEGKRGAIKAGPPVACRNAEEAQRRADKAMAGGAIIGCHVVRVMADEEAGDYGDPEFLGTFGRVPDVG